jgi:hypothetical protein
MFITTRSKIAIRWTTAPGDLGYSGTATNWKTQAADKVTSPAKALDFVAQLKKELGGVFFAVNFQCQGQEVTREELEEVVMYGEFEKSAS